MNTLKISSQSRTTSKVQTRALANTLHFVFEYANEAYKQQNALSGQ